MKINLAGDRLLLKVDKLEQAKKTTGGILLPETRDKREDPQTGTIVEIGPGFFTHAGEFIPIGKLVPGAKAGARVAFQRNGAQETTWNLEGEDHLIVRSGEVIGVLRG